MHVSATEKYATLILRSAHSISVEASRVFHLDHAGRIIYLVDLISLCSLPTVNHADHHAHPCNFVK